MICSYNNLIRLQENQKNKLLLRMFTDGCHIHHRYDIQTDSKLYSSQNDYDCVLLAKTRGGNAKDNNCTLDDRSYIGYDNFNSYSLQEYLLVPCKQSTYRNEHTCDITKCCSAKHQLFNNITKGK